MSATLKCVIAGTVWSVAAAIGGCSEGHLGLDGSDQAAAGRGGANQAGGAGQSGAVPRDGGQAGGTLGSAVPPGPLLGSAGHAAIVGTGNSAGGGDPGAAGQGGTGDGCGGYGGYGDPRADQAAEARLLQLADTVTVLQFSTVGRLNHEPDLSFTVTDPAAARDAFRATIDLPVMPPGTYNCPAGPTGAYELRGFDSAPSPGACPVIFATVQPGECQNASVVGGSDHIDRWSSTAPGYWYELAADLGVTVDALFAH